MRPLIKLAANLIRNYSLKREFFCPEQIIKCCEGARATFMPGRKGERNQHLMGGRREPAQQM